MVRYILLKIFGQYVMYQILNGLKNALVFIIIN